MVSAVICVIIGSVILVLYRAGRIAMTNYTVRNLGIILLGGGLVFGALTLLS
jgi:hypothetical protein